MKNVSDVYVISYQDKETHHWAAAGSVSMTVLCVSIRVNPTVTTLRSFGSILGTCVSTTLASSWDHNLKALIE